MLETWLEPEISQSCTFILPCPFNIAKIKCNYLVKAESILTELRLNLAPIYVAS